MPFRFPQADHIPLNNPPLREVVCQIRFPPILKIGEAAPAEFQDAIRQRFPKYKAEHGIHFQLAPGRPVQSLEARPQIHRFSDRTEASTVSLGIDFVALSASKYTGWRSFSDDLEFVTDQVFAIYHVPYAIRVGLRYINALNVYTTGLDEFDPDVLAILRPELTVLFHQDEIIDPHFAITQMRTRQEDGEFSFRAGIIEEKDDQETMSSFVLDFDRYVEAEEIELDTQSVLNRCDRYHDEIYNAFRWCILPDQLTLFGPLDRS